MDKVTWCPGSIPRKWGFTIVHYTQSADQLPLKSKDSLFESNPRQKLDKFDSCSTFLPVCDLRYKLLDNWCVTEFVSFIFNLFIFQTEGLEVGLHIQV